VARRIYLLLKRITSIAVTTFGCQLNVDMVHVHFSSFICSTDRQLMVTSVKLLLPQWDLLPKNI